MSESISTRIAKIPDPVTRREMKALYDEILTDMGNLRTAITGITAKLDADAGITDTDYASLHDPDALNLTS